MGVCASYSTTRSTASKRPASRGARVPEAAFAPLAKRHPVALAPKRARLKAVQFQLDSRESDETLDRRRRGDVLGRSRRLRARKGHVGRPQNAFETDFGIPTELLTVRYRTYCTRTREDEKLLYHGTDFQTLSGRWVSKKLIHHGNSTRARRSKRKCGTCGVFKRLCELRSMRRSYFRASLREVQPS